MCVLVHSADKYSRTGLGRSVLAALDGEPLTVLDTRVSCSTRSYRARGRHVEVDDWLALLSFGRFGR
ncbi:hypothetical protein [Kitasatospora sp. NPDC050463]|uniref:hypothetical protein n=1 Tax=Kitasatospora sp. NPDC050463 TaxID=3155786 RepID=UPI0033CD4A4F